MATTYEHTHVADSDTVSAPIAGYGISYAITAIFSAILVVLKETIPAVHDLMVAITGHHWVTHGILNLIVFVLLGWLLTRWTETARMSARTLILTIVGSVVVSGVITAGFFLT